MALPRATDVEYLGTNMSGGMSMGASSTEKISFYGATPIAKRTLTAATTTATTATNEAAIHRIEDLLVLLGLCVTS